MFANNPKSYGTLAMARTILAENPDARDEIIACLVGIEKRLQQGTELDMRENLSGPLVDLLFEDGAPLVREVADGTSFHFEYSSRIAREFVMAAGSKPDHVWEPQTTRSLISLSRGRRTVIVGGAYFGDHALFIAKALEAGGVCHCFELSPQSLALLRRNISANGVSNIVVNQMALWSSDGARIALAGHDSHATPSEATVDDAESFPSCTIDSYVETNRIAAVDVVMLDIEGGETAALQGASRLLSKDAAEAPALICEIHRTYDDFGDGLRKTRLCGLLLGHGYEVFAIRDYQGNQPMADRFVELVDIDSAVVSGPPHGFNLLAVKSRARLDPSVFRIVHGVSPKLLFHRDAALHAPLDAGHEVP